MVVDDNSFNYIGMENFIKIAGYTPIHALNGKDAITKILELV